MITVFVDKYADKDPFRNQELIICDRKRKQNPFHETVDLEGRSTHTRFFNIINQTLKPGEIGVYCNSDIFFDHTIQLAENIGDNEVYALSRYDITKKGMAVAFHRPDSQDAWIFRAPIKPVDANFFLGIGGTDNKVAYLLKQAGYKVTNPCKSIHAFHLHLSGVRNYISKGRVETVPGPYELLNPCWL